MRVLSWNLYHGRDYPPDKGLFTWRSRLTYAANRNRIERLTASSDTIIVGYLNAVIEGQPIGVFYGGVYQRDASGNRIHRDTTISGTVSTNLGTFEFSGSKR